MTYNTNVSSCHVSVSRTLSPPARLPPCLQPAPRTAGRSVVTLSVAALSGPARRLPGPREEREKRKKNKEREKRERRERKRRKEGGRRGEGERKERERRERGGREEGEGGERERPPGVTLSGVTLSEAGRPSPRRTPTEPHPGTRSGERLTNLPWSAHRQRRATARRGRRL